MPRPKLRDGQLDFRGGLNTASDEDTVEGNEIRRADEAVLTEFGAVLKRFGTQRLSDAPIGLTLFAYAVGASFSGSTFARTGTATYTGDI